MSQILSNFFDFCLHFVNSPTIFKVLFCSQMEAEKNLTSFLDLFYGTNCTRWKGKLFFILTVLKIAYVLDPKLEPFPKPKEDETEVVKVARKKREDDELMCRGHIFNTLSDRLYDLYNFMTSPLEI